jgi:hypothetical protein
VPNELGEMKASSIHAVAWGCFSQFIAS